MRFYKYKPMGRTMPRRGLKSLSETVTAIRGVEYALAFARGYPTQKLDISVEPACIRIVNTNDAGAGVEFHASAPPNHDDEDKKELEAARATFKTLHTFLRQLCRLYDGHWWILDVCFVTDHRVRRALYDTFGHILGEQVDQKRSVASLISEISRHDLATSAEIAVVDDGEIEVDESDIVDDGDEEKTRVFTRQAVA